MNNFYKTCLLLTFIFLSLNLLNAQWTKCTNVPGNDSIYTNPAGVGLRDLAVNGSRLFVMRIASVDSIFYSDDNGTTWHVSKPPGVVIAGTTYYPALAHVWVHNGIIFASGSQGTSNGTLYLWRSTDNGGTWTASSAGITSTYPGPTPKVLYGNGSTLYAGTENSGILLSTNNGLNWSIARHGIATYSFGGLTSYVNINGLVAVGNHLFAGLGGNISAAGYGVVHSTLGDTNWTSVNSGLPTNAVIQSLITVGSTLYASAVSYATFSYGVFKSTDLGSSWKKVSTGLPYPGSTQSLYAVGNTIFGFTGTALFELNNGDTTWSAVNTTGLPSTYSIAGFAVVGTNMFMTGLDLSVSLKTTTLVWKRGIGEITDVQENTPTIPDNFSLAQNYPNPFNPTTVIRYELPVESWVTLKVYNIIGEEVATLVNSEESAGFKSVVFNASKLSSGVYTYKLSSGGYTVTKKLLLSK